MTSLKLQPQRLLFILFVVTFLPIQANLIASERPNIIVILTDDMGFSDLGCYGGEIATPNLDRLAKNGIRFNQFYNTARCCPTRACLLTGLYQHQAGIGHMTGNSGHPSYQGYLNDNCVTIAEVLRDAGYHTLCAGKWHVGSQRGKWPLDRGFDKYFGCPTGGGFYFRNTMQSKKRILTLGNEEVGFPEGEYVTDLFTDYALQFVDEAAQSDRPFFLYLPHIAPHWPLQAKPEDIEKYAGRYEQGWDRIRAQRYQRQLDLGIVSPQWGKSDRSPAASAWDGLDEDTRQDLSHRMAVYAAQIDSIDQNVGRIISLLKRHEAFENTVIMFVSDNGCSAEGGAGGFRRGDVSAAIGTDASYASAGLEWANVSDTPFRKFKSHTHEGGISTPMIVHWPDAIEPANASGSGRIETAVGHVLDLMPTCVELANADYPETRAGAEIWPMEGRSLVPTLLGRPSARQQPLFWEHEGNRAVRDGDWKLVASHKGRWELYNLANDRAEMHDLSAEQLEIVSKLSQAWNQWAARCGVQPWPVKRKKMQSPKVAQANSDEIAIFDGKTLENWRTVKEFDFEQHGKIEVRDGSIHLEEGKPATGISIKTKIPKSNYELTFSARRVKGSDFFCGLTFPIKEEFCTLILGGWGGQIVGLSNIDTFNAAENNTTQVIDFKNGQWYKVKLRVTDEFIHIWVDGEQIIEVEANRHKFSIYWEQEPVRPLGIVTWYTHGEIKDLKLRKVSKSAGDEATDEK